MRSDLHDVVYRVSSLLSKPGMQRLSEQIKECSALAESIERQPPPLMASDPSRKLNKLLREANEVALEANNVARDTNEVARDTNSIASRALARAAAAEADAAVARRAAILANIIATIAIAITVRDQLVELVMSLLR